MVVAMQNIKYSKNRGLLVVTVILDKLMAIWVP